MKCRHYLDAVEVLKLTAKTSDSNLGIQEIFHRRVSEDDNDLGLNGGDFAKQKGLAGCRLIRHWSAIPGRAAPVNVSYQHILPLETDRLDNLS